MRLQYTKILLFFFPLNILLTSYHAHNTNKPYITPHHTQTNRSLCECDTQSSNYNKDTGMKSVMQQFVDRTSQRFEEYKERLKDKRQKRKEERDKNIQKIIEKDKMDKSLAEKVEKGCLKCGCALGGGVLPVWGLVSGIWYASLSQHATKLATDAGIKKGLQVGLAEIKNIFENSSRTGKIPEITVTDMLSSGKFTNGVNFYDMFQHINTMFEKLKDDYYNYWYIVNGIAEVEGIDKFNAQNGARIAAVEKAFDECKAAEFASHTSLLSNTIIASVVTILVIVLVMIIVYLVLRYRRKKKMKKKAQYTKLLNQ
ncbi:rifin PIR protein, putative [Plasmodium reichenowi]|uniref:Rifin PIR protein, putative n=1 Tax=Plasmodium reichenowi TaxID=5854 RepID=A0A2P9DSN1_PLARE|nr:rifin PIR protein, putative [Plasmodium reichenowi]